MKYSFASRRPFPLSELKAGGLCAFLHCQLLVPFNSNRKCSWYWIQLLGESHDRTLGTFRAIIVMYMKFSQNKGDWYPDHESSLATNSRNSCQSCIWVCFDGFNYKVMDGYISALNISIKGEKYSVAGTWLLEILDRFSKVTRGKREVLYSVVEFFKITFYLLSSNSLQCLFNSEL